MTEGLADVPAARLRQLRGTPVEVTGLRQLSGGARRESWDITWPPGVVTSRSASPNPVTAATRRSWKPPSSATAPRRAPFGQPLAGHRAIQFPRVELQTQAGMLRALIGKTAWNGPLTRFGFIKPDTLKGVTG